MTLVRACGTPELNSGTHILIVDDDLEIRQLLARYLAEQGFQVTTAESGSKMNQALATRAHDLVVLDVMLEDASGLDLCRALRSRSTTPIILLTALKEDIDRIVGLELGADDYVSKPFNPRDLLARIRAVLRRSTQVQASLHSSCLPAAPDTRPLPEGRPLSR
jgi:two-component system OmpR family response regulator